MNHFNIMEKNPFVKNKKYNPDVLVNHGKKIGERTNVEYKKKDELFNSQINSTSLNVKLDKPINDLDNEIQRKILERKDQEFDFKGKKNIIPSSNPNEFNQFNDLKNNKERDNENKQIIKDENNYDNVMDDLKKLGILN